MLRVVVSSKWGSFERPGCRRFFGTSFATKAYAKLAPDSNDLRRDRVTGCNGKAILCGVFCLKGRLPSCSFAGTLRSRLRGVHRATKNDRNDNGESFSWTGNLRHGPGKPKKLFYFLKYGSQRE
jgi:hypothetical protein